MLHSNHGNAQPLLGNCRVTYANIQIKIRTEANACKKKNCFLLSRISTHSARSLLRYTRYTTQQMWLI